MYNSPITAPAQPSKPNPFRKNLTIILALFLLLTIANIALYVFRGSRGGLQNQLSEKEQVLAALKAQNAAINTQLDSLKLVDPKSIKRINELQSELEHKNFEISQKVHLNGDLKLARREIEALTHQKNAAISDLTIMKEKVTTLNNQVAILSSEKQQYESERQQYEKGINEVRAQLEEAQIAKAALVSEKSKVEQDNFDLNAHIESNKYLTISNVTAQTVTINKKGKEKNTSSRKSADQIKICFQYGKNDLIPMGDEKVFIKIVDPMGATIFREDQGSGIMTDKDSNTEFRFTMATTFQYNQREGEACGHWNIGTDTPGKGKYLVEIYNRGKRVGTSAFKIK